MERFPDGHIHNNERVVIVRDIRGIASGRLESPDKAGSRISDSIDGIKLGDKASDFRVVNGCEKAADINLCKMESHGGLFYGGMHRGYVKKRSKSQPWQRKPITEKRRPERGPSRRWLKRRLVWQAVQRSLA